MSNKSSVKKVTPIVIKDSLANFISSLTRMKFKDQSTRNQRVFSLMTYDNYWTFVTRYQEVHRDRFVKEENYN